MKTEIQGDFKGYLLRFKMPTKKSFFIPLKSAGLIFLFELLFSGIFISLGIQTWSLVISLIICMIAVCYYIKVLYKRFWNIVLEESKGFLPDLIMWIYYITLCIISLSPAFVLFYLSEIVVR